MTMLTVGPACELYASLTGRTYKNPQSLFDFMKRQGFTVEYGAFGFLQVSEDDVRAAALITPKNRSKRPRTEPKPAQAALVDSRRATLRAMAIKRGVYAG